MTARSRLMASVSDHRPQAIDPLQLVRPREVAALFRIHLISVYRWERQGKLPKAIKLANGHVAWRRRDLEALLDQRQAEAEGLMTTVRSVAIPAPKGRE